MNLKPKELRRALRLMVITNVKLARPKTVEFMVEAALKGGARAVQLREKGGTAKELLPRARKLRELTRSYDALLIINNRLDVALAVEADGVHLGAEDFPVGAARSTAPKGFIIGYSTNVAKAAKEAAAQGASYIGCGSVYPTITKEVVGDSIGVSGLARVAKAVEIPVLGIGGITVEGAQEIADGSGAAGVAVISAIMRAEDAEVTAKELLAPFEEQD
jgi:thiamine-phosphate pyrophosphorylase